MNILASSLLVLPPQRDLPPQVSMSPVQSIGRYLRRADRFSQLALNGAHLCTRDTVLTPSTPLVMVSNSGAGSSMEELRTSVIDRGTLPAPYTFLNSLSTSASFMVAKALSLSSEQYSFTGSGNSFESVLYWVNHSGISQRADTILLGCTEEGADGGDHPHAVDWSAWFLLSAFPSGRAIGSVAVERDGFSGTVRLSASGGKEERSGDPEGFRTGGDRMESPPSAVLFAHRFCGEHQSIVV